ncbi:hypothetical protein IWX90DRAFT_179477 [Phyllosticta citrichinensis]|uniref:Uncharacterized protein n=1 Tax=Phyllosticta citrichinensis TaxID=1130410 RepID=A0ABR1XVX4_9PEZI
MVPERPAQPEEHCATRRCATCTCRITKARRFPAIHQLQTSHHRFHGSRLDCDALAERAVRPELSPNSGDYHLLSLTLHQREKRMVVFIHWHGLHGLEIKSVGGRLLFFLLQSLSEQTRLFYSWSKGRCRGSSFQMLFFWRLRMMECQRHGGHEPHLGLHDILLNLSATLCRPCRCATKQHEKKTSKPQPAFKALQQCQAQGHWPQSLGQKGAAPRGSTLTV